MAGWTPLGSAHAVPPCPQGKTCAGRGLSPWGLCLSLQLRGRAGRGGCQTLDLQALAASFRSPAHACCCPGSLLPGDSEWM